MLGESKPTSSVYVLGARDTAIDRLAGCNGHREPQIRYFSQPDEFISMAVKKSPDCLMIDLDAGPHTCELQVQLVQRGCRAIVIAIATRPDVEAAIKVMEGGALTLLRKPLQLDICEYYLQRALKLARDERQMRSAYASLLEKEAGLSSRQRDILWSVLNGQPSKAIAAQLDVSNRLVELERSRLLKIFQSESTTELALKFGEFIALRRAFACDPSPNFSRLRSPVDRDPPRTPDEG